MVVKHGYAEANVMTGLRYFCVISEQALIKDFKSEISYYAKIVKCLGHTCIVIYLSDIAYVKLINIYQDKSIKYIKKCHRQYVWKTQTMSTAWLE